MKVKLSILAAAALAATFGLSGCGGNEDPSSVVTPTTPAAAVTGVAVDGYIANGDICVDTDGNESTCEWTGKTDAAGAYSIPAAYGSGKIIISGGIDLDTNASFKGVLKAPAGSKVASPLTTLLAEGMSETQIKTILNLPADTDLSKDFRASGEFDADVAKAALSVQAIIGQIYSVLAAGSTQAPAEIMSAVVEAIQTNITTNTALTDSTVLQSVIEDAAAATSVTLTSGEINTLTTAIDNTVTTVQTTTLTEENVATTVQDISDAQLMLVGVYAKKNELTIGGQTVTYDQAGAWSDVNVSVPTSTTPMTIAVNVVNQDEITATPKAVTLGVKIDDLASSRELKAILTGATVSLVNNEVVVTVPAGAVLYVEAMDSASNTVIPKPYTNAVADILVSSGNVLSLDLSTLMSKLPTEVANLNVAGNYAVSFYMDGMTLGYDDSASGPGILYLNAPEETLSVSTSTGTRTLTGSKFSGKVNIQ